MLKTATTLCNTSTGWPSLFFHPLFSLDAHALCRVDRRLAKLKDPLFLCTTLMVSAAKNRTDQMRWALRHGVLVNDQDSLGMTALHYAALSGSRDAVKLLVDFGATPSLVDRKGRTARQYAEMRRDRVLLGMI